MKTKMKMNKMKMNKKIMKMIMKIKIYQKMKK